MEALMGKPASELQELYNNRVLKNKGAKKDYVLKGIP